MNFMSIQNLRMMCMFMILFTIIVIYANEYKGPCRERNRFMSVDQVNEFEMLDVNLGKTAILECRYCDEDAVNEPRIWLRTKHVNRTAIQDEVKLGMIANLTTNRIYMTLDHCLYVQKVTKDDAGLYFCKGLEGDDTDFQYSVDVVSEHTKIIKGELSKWNTFINKTITPLNLNISKSIDNEIVKLINVTGVFVKVMSEWEDWGPCDGCLETRERIAKCRIKPKINHVIHPLHNSTMTEDLHNLFSSLKLSCHSLQLQERLPHLSQLVSNVPNFLITEDCIGPCKQRKSGKGAKYHNTYHLLERSFVTFICPETNLSSVVVWRKNGKVIKANKFSSSNSLSPTVYVDTFNILHFEGAKLIDKGNYTCYVNKVQMQEIIISIGSHPLFDFAMFGLGFVFLFFMSLFVYSAGVVIAYNRRYMYKSLKFV